MSELSKFVDLVKSSDRMVAFTGAGISTESGIPDFRSPGGVWSKMSPIYFQDFVSSRDQRREAWNRVFNKTAGWTGAPPNDGHRVLSGWVNAGKMTSIITQNVDNLHQDSGTPDDRVIEVHGNATYCKCLDCGQRYETDDLEPMWKADEDIICDACNGLIKTATISFGQPMPETKMLHAQAEAELCDLFIVLGSSLVVFPAANLPIIAKQNGARLVIINREPTEMDQIADLVVSAEIGPFLTEALAQLD